MTDTPVVVRGRHSLTPIQRALYASQQLHPRSPLLNMVRLARIEGPVDPVRLARAFAVVVEASDALRTQIRTGPDREKAVQLSDEPAETEIVEVTRADAGAWAAARAREVLPLARRAYDSAVLVHEDATISWYLAFHHCVTDATSWSLVFRRTAEVYAEVYAEGYAEGYAEVYAEGYELELDSYYEWAARVDDPGPARERAARHWAERPPAPRLGHLYERHLQATPSSTRLPVAVDAEVEAALESRLEDVFRSVSADLSWTTALLTATAAYLYRITGATAFALGVPIHNRSRPDARELIGPLVEVFPVDVAVEPDDTFVSLHERVSRSLNQTLRFAQPGTAPAANEIEAVVNVIPGADLGRFGSFAASVERVHSGASDGDHLLRVQLSRETGIDLALDVNDAAVSSERRERAAGHFLEVLRQMVASPESPVAGFSLLQDDEARALERWGRGPAPTAPCVHTVDLLREALHGAEHVALLDGDRSWTASELWDHVRLVATDLQSKGVGPGSRVAVEMERCADSVIAILATMVAGGSYVPIDPTQPEVRRTRLLERARCLLTLRSLPSPLDDGASPRSLDRSLDDEAYLLFTSGSTGEPKGVPISHRGLASYLAFASSTYLDGDERPVVPLFSALTFDLTVTSLFLPLLAGGRVVVVRGDGPTAMRDVAETRHLTWCKATPSHLELLVRLLPDDHSLATLVVGGEAFGAPLARRLWERLPDLRIYNEYGPTEAVVGCMVHEGHPDEHPGSPDVPIGRPAPGVGLRVLDSHGHLVPPGAVGELHISHHGLTAGYLDGDASAFVEIDDERWYRSGDLVRMLDDDTLVYLRRTDEQLKVGGIRLDPSEIEAALVEHPAVRRAAVRAWAPTHREPSRYCVRCGLADNVPGVAFDQQGVCDRCHAYDSVKERAELWFKDPDDLLAERDRARRLRSGDVDCVALLSGGKDSTYALFQLVRMGFDVHALTLDNGFISDEAKANIRHSIAALGIEHEFATTEAMAAIFRDSLQRHSNVCHGCFKTIYTLATNRAVDLGAPLVVTGLSRGQLFETRLIPAQFSERRFDPEAIDAAVVAARKAYHRTDDSVARLLDTDVFADDALFDRISYLDFYRYVDVELSEVFRFLDEEAPWVRPSDTGRSTNCRINAAGIQTHLQEQGYHNYAEPYAWDVRLGHKRRDEALAELDDRDDADHVAAMLSEVGYLPRSRETLTGWVETRPGVERPSPNELRAHLQALVPTHAIPAAFVVTDEMPMTASGKLDVDALPAPERTHHSSPTLVLEPSSPLERTIIELWERQLGIEPISANDDFFALGGDSLGALEMTMLLSDELGVEVPDEVAFANATPRALALAVGELPDGDALVRSAPNAGDGGDPPRLSAGEQAMLFEHLLRPDDTRYNVGRLYRVDATIDAGRFRAAVAAVVARHQPLHWTYSTPRRKLTVDEALVFDAVATDSWDEVRATVRDIHRRPFDLDSGPLVRCAVFDVDGEATAIALVTHHVSTDASCFERLWNEIEAAYHGDELTPLRITYADHNAWQAAAAAEEASYWREAVGTVTPLALHRPDANEPDGVHRRVAQIDADELRTAAGTAPFATVLAALAAVLRRYTGSDEVTVGALVSTRDHPLADDLVGYYLNTLPLTFDAHADQTFAELRASCGDVLARGLAHRTHPFADMVAERRRDSAADPTPQVLVAMEDMDTLTFGRHAAAQEVLLTGSSVADATVFVQPRDGALVLVMEHRGDVVGATAADQLLADLDTALSAVLRSPGQTVGSCHFASQDRSVVTGPPALSAPHVVEQIVRQARQRGDAPAVRSGSTSLSWAELDRWSAALVGRFADVGVRPGDRVVVALPRSIELVVAIVGILRAGAAYIPIDPSYPAKRNQAIAASSGATAIIADDTTLDLGVDAPRVAIPSLSAVADSGAPVALPPPEIDAAAYVLYTSGSTGEPRGVVVGHRQLAHSTAARGAAYPQPPERFLLMSSVAFDSSVAGLFWTLTTGGTIVLPTDSAVHDVDAVLDLIARHRVTHTLVVPSLYRALLTRATPDAPWPTQVIVAGEACGRDVVAAHFAEHPDARLTNEYGPTEATVWSTFEHLVPTAGGVPIGSPIAGAWAVVVDEYGDRCPDGVIGELVLGGAGIASGYDGVESDRFRPECPHGPGPVFHTGDRAAVVDGRLHFHGRLDEQLNIGGVRIEPAEIETALEELDEVSRAAVVARDLRPIERRLTGASPATVSTAMRRAADDPDPTVALAAGLADEREATLVAHLESDSGDVDLDRLRAHVGERLTPSSRPTVFCVYDRLPRSPNGKLDRTAIGELPVDSAARAPTPAPGANLDANLDALVGFYRQAIGRDDIGPDDDFFDAGGDSLLALELLVRIERAHGLRPRVSVLFEARTPRALHAALGLDGSDRHGAGDGAIVVQPGRDDTAPLWLLPGGGGVLLVFERLVALLDPDLPILGVEYPGTRGECPPCETVEEIGAHYYRALVAAQPRGPYRLLGYSVGGLVALDVVRRLREDGRDVSFVGAVAAGLSEAEDHRGLSGKMADAWRTGGPRWVAARLGVQVGARLRLAPERLRRRARAWAEQQAIDRFGLRPSDRLLFIRMRAVSRAAGMRYQAPVVDAEVSVFMGDDGTDRRVEVMTRAWEQVAGRGVDVVIVAGTHDDNAMLVDPDQVRSLASAITTALGHDR